MEWLPLAIIAGLVVSIGMFRAYLRGRREEADRREIEERRAQQKADEEAREATAAWLDMKAVFPYLQTPHIEEPTADKIYKEIGFLLSFPTSIGKIADNGLPVPTLPDRERRRHLYVVGKTGSGKSTFLEHLIADDLEGRCGVGVIAPEPDFFRRRLLPLVPESRDEEVIYFAPGDPKCPLTFNPLALEDGEDRVRAAEDLFTIFRRALVHDDLGARMQPIIQNAFAALVGRPGMTLWHVKRMLENADFRARIVKTLDDEYVKTFWLETYPRYPKGADLPLISRLDQFLRPPTIRRTLCHPQSSFSVKGAIDSGHILFIDLSGLSEENRTLIGQMILSKFQLELMRRERIENDLPPYYLYADEFQTFAGAAEGTWRELMSRGRKYGLCLTVAHQYPAQLPTGLQEEILGNVNSIVAFALGSKDAQAMHREFLVRKVEDGEERLEPVKIAQLTSLATGEAYVRLAGGRAIKMLTAPPKRGSRTHRTEEVIAASWAKFAAAPLAATDRHKKSRSMNEDAAEFLE
jgi:hypothetical protein